MSGARVSQGWNADGNDFALCRADNRGGSGIGLAIAKTLAREGARVAVGDIEANALRQAAAEIGGDAAGFESDVRNRSPRSQG